MFGGDGFDRLYGGTGNDTLDGGNNDDSFYGGTGDDAMFGGSGFDWLFFTGTTGGVTIAVSSGTGTATGDGSDTFTSIDFIYGTSFGDTFTGGSSGEQFAPGLGDDVVNGGDGTDWVTYFNIGASIVVDLGLGTATGGGGNDVLLSIEQVGGTPFADTFTGNASNNHFRGDDSGTGAADTFYGGAGNDEVDYRAEASRVVIDLPAGTATNGIGIVDRLFSIENADGSSFGDTIYGTADDNFLNGRGGDDTIFGGYGGDFIVAGSGNDYIDGGALYNFDRFDLLDYDYVDYSGIGATAKIVVDMAAHTVSGDASVGVDTILNVEGVRGTNFDDTFYGGGGARFEEFRGGAGNDLIVGTGIYNIGSDYGSATGSVTIVLTGAADGLGSATGGGVGTDTLRYVNQFYSGGFDDLYDASAFVLDLTDNN